VYIASKRRGELLSVVSALRQRGDNSPKSQISPLIDAIAP
jgi:hypothetical protein